MKGTHNPITIFKTKKYLKENKNSKYYPYFGLETYVGGQRKTEKQLQELQEQLN